MALASYKKVDLIKLAHELEIQVSESDGVKKIIRLIEEDPSYNKELTVTLVKTIAKDRIEQEQKAEKERELERIEKERDFERQKEENERLERQALREFELQKAQLERETEIASNTSIRTDKTPQVSLKNIMQKFDEDKSDISLFLNLFQKQAEKAGIEETNYTSHLIPLLPVNISEIVLREASDNFDDFQYIKNLLLKRFKLSPENLRLKFVTQQRQQGSLWKDLYFDLSNSLEGWLDGLQISDFEALKKLMITDQLKRRASAEAKDHFIDSWAEFKDPQILADKLDNFELVRKIPKRNLWHQNKFEEKDKAENQPIFERKFEQTRSLENRDSFAKPADAQNWRDKSDKERTKAFEKKEVRKCFICNSSSHLKNSCRKNKEEIITGTVNFIINQDCDLSFGPYLSKGFVNNKECTILRDCGSNVDVVGSNFVNQNDFTGKKIWLRQPLDSSIICLPLARIKLETPDGTVFTKAAVVDKNIKMQHYLLGNETFRLLEKCKEKPKLGNATKNGMGKFRKNSYNFGRIDKTTSPPRKFSLERNKEKIGAAARERICQSPDADNNPGNKGNENRVVLSPPKRNAAIEQEIQNSKQNEQILLGKMEEMKKTVELRNETSRDKEIISSLLRENKILQKNILALNFIEQAKSDKSAQTIESLNKGHGEIKSVKRESKQKQITIDLVRSGTDRILSNKKGVGNWVPKMQVVKSETSYTNPNPKVSNGEKLGRDNSVINHGTSEKIREILNSPPPKTKTEVRKILGLAKSCSQYVQNFTILVEPLNRVLKRKGKKKKITWETKVEHAFQNLKAELSPHVECLSRA